MKRYLRIVVIIAIFVLIFFALITSSVKSPDLANAVWNQAMLKGETEHPARHYIVYTDLMCPYCNYYAKNIQDNPEAFAVFLSEHKIAYEVRMTDMLYESSGVTYSRPAAEGAYCAARVGRFWDYYAAAISALFEDYYQHGIGNSKTAPKIEDMTRDYWLKLGQELELGEAFETCYNNREAVSEIATNTAKAAQTAAGLPYFTFGSFSTGGFDPSWDWEITEQLLSAGLK